MRSIYNRLIFIITCTFLLNCSNKNYVIYNSIEGTVMSSLDNKPIKYARIYVNKYSSNNFDTITTNIEGHFFIDGLELPRKYLHYQSNLSYDYFVEKQGYKKKKIIIKNLKETVNNKLDTINLGEIYLEPDK